MYSTRTIALALALSAAAAHAQGAELLVHAAASLTESLRELAATHESRTGVRVRLNLGASSMLARQALEGAPGDVFFSADEARMDQLAEARLIVPATRRRLLSNTLVLVVSKDSDLAIRSSADLGTALVESVALADPGSVPAGIYAKEHLRRAGIWLEVLPKVVPTENVRGALAAVESGNVDVAIVYRTDALVSDRVRVAWEVPADQAPDIAHPVAVMAASAHAEEASAFVDLLASEEARVVFERHGFIVLPRRRADP